MPCRLAYGAQLRVRNPPWESSGSRIPPGFLRNCVRVPRNLGSMGRVLQAWIRRRIFLGIPDSWESSGILRNLFGARITVCAGTPRVGSPQGPPDAPPSLHLVQGTSLTHPHHSPVLPITLNHHNGTDSSYRSGGFTGRSDDRPCHVAGRTRAPFKARNSPWESSGSRIPPGFLRNCS